MGTRGPRPLNILSLPGELLIEIFEAVNKHGPSVAGPSEDIANVRLVCRRFAACSSHLLVRYVRLDGINSESLEKLEAISRHPLIRNGACTVRFVARFYSAVFANDIRRFAWYAVNQVFGSALRYKGIVEAALDVGDGLETHDSRRHKASMVMERVKAILQTWSRVSLGEVENIMGSLTATGRNKLTKVTLPF